MGRQMKGIKRIEEIESLAEALIILHQIQVMGDLESANEARRLIADLEQDVTPEEFKVCRTLGLMAAKQMENQK